MSASDGTRYLAYSEPIAIKLLLRRTHETTCGAEVLRNTGIIKLCSVYTIMGDRGPDPEADKKTILETIRNHWAPVIGTADLADEIGVARQTMDRKLRKLKEEEHVNTDKIGQSRVWWITTKGRKFLAEE